MNDTFYYPALDIQTIKNLDLVRQLASDHPSYWLESPYSGEVELMCKKWFAPSKRAEVPFESEADLDIDMDSNARFEMLYRESAILYKNLKAAGEGMTEISEKNAYYRTATSLLEKLIALQERALGIKQIHEFQTSVLDILENVLTPTQRNEVMDQLRNSISRS